MVKHSTYSKLLHILLILCFFLPFFFYTGCGPSAEDKVAQEKVKQDSIAAFERQADTLLKDTISESVVSLPAKDTVSDAVDTSKIPDLASVPEKNEDLNLKICEKFPFLRPILNPSKDVYSGMGMILASIAFYSMFSGFISFLLLLIGLLLKFIEPASKRTFVVLDVLALFFLCSSAPISLDYEILWGVWVAVSISVILTGYDIFILLKRK